MSKEKITLNNLLKRFWKNISLTWILIISEGIAILLFPLVIGWTVDDLVSQKMDGLMQLLGLCLFLVVVGAGRRFYDTRVYSDIYKKVSHEMVLREKSRKTSVSKISARATLFTEFVEFLENSLPDIFNHMVGLAGTLLIIVFINPMVFWVCLGGAVLVTCIFALSQKKMFSFNKGQNDELERQVDAISSPNKENLRSHFHKVMQWNIKLSDLETINFSLSWLVLSGVILSSIVVVAASGTATSGEIIAIIMYVFGFVESIMTFPLYYQQLVRLQEIAGRLG